MAAQPLSREDNPSIFISSHEPDLASPPKTSTAKSSAAKSKTSTAKTGTAKTGTAKTPRKTVAKTATRRRSVTKSVPIVDFPTPENVRWSTTDLGSSLPIQPDYPQRLATPSFTSHPASDSLRSQLAACRQVLTELQAESQELQQTMASLIAIASEMETLKPSRNDLTALTTPTPRKSSTRKTTSRAISQPDQATQTQSKAKVAKSAAAIGSDSANKSVNNPLNTDVNYWGNLPLTKPNGSREIQLPNFTPSNSSGKQQHRTPSLTRQTVEYYAGYSHPPTQLELTKPSFRSTVRSTVKSTDQPAAKPVSQFVAKPVVQPDIRTVPKSIAKPVSPSFKSTAKSMDFSPTPTQGTIVRPQVPSRPQQIRLNTNHHRYTFAHYYQIVKQQLQQLIPIPKGEGAILLDAFCWTVGAIGIRMSCQMLINLLPILTLPLNLALLCPALLATYLAFCIPKSSSAAVYRCLLLTLGFFLSGKL